MLTSINHKLDAIYGSGTQYAVLNEVTPQSFTQGEIIPSAASKQLASRVTLADAGIFLALAIGMFIAWHLSRIYHSHQWTKTILKKSFVHYQQPLEEPAESETLHPDQDCVGDPPPADGRIKESWLPPYARAFYAGWRH
jgi:hypothetical protein